MYFTQVRVSDVGVYLGGVNRRVTKELLHRADIGAIAQKVGCKRVAKRMRCDDTRDPCMAYIQFQMALDITGGDAMKSFGSAIDEERFLHIVARFKVHLHGFFSGRGDEDHAHLLTLAAY